MSEAITKGAIMLDECGASLKTIAIATNTSKSAARRWKIGECVPNPEARELLHAAFNIPPSAWERERAPVTRAPRPEYPAPPEGASGVERARHAFACIRVDLQRPDLSTAVRSRLRRDELRAIALVAKLEADEELEEPRYLFAHPALKKLAAAVLAALEPHPEALRAVERAFDDSASA